MKIENDQYFMRLALQEACKGKGRTSPNPCVGAVVVKNNIVIAKGYHAKAGSPHAEVHALLEAGSEAHDATIYVTLEPCNHVGKTPPCSHAILKSGIKRVVVGMEDPNPLVDGSGINFLRKHGVEVIAGVLSQECVKINRPFIKFITTGPAFDSNRPGSSHPDSSSSASSRLSSMRSIRPYSTAASAPIKLSRSVSCWILSSG